MEIVINRLQKTKPLKILEPCELGMLACRRAGDETCADKPDCHRVRKVFLEMQ